MGERKKAKVDNTAAMIDEFHEGWAQSMKDDEAAAKAAPKVHDPGKGEFVEEVDPKNADKHLED